jgi:hypothetical protein
VANHMIACAVAGTNHKNATTLSVDFPCSSWAHFCFSFMVRTYLGHLSSCEVIIFIFVVEIQFLL